MQLLSLCVAILIQGVRLLLLSLLVACSGSDNPFNPPRPATPTTRDQMAKLLNVPKSIGFAEVSRFVFGAQCINCHGDSEPAGKLSLTSYKDLVASASLNMLHPGEPNESTLYTSLIAEQGLMQMPPNGGDTLTVQQKQLVFEWIKAGAPEVAGGKGLKIVSLEDELKPYFETPEKIDYEVIKRFVFEPGRCFDCHSEKGTSPDYRAIFFGANMTSYQDLFYINGIVKGVPEDIWDGDPGYGYHLEGSRIYKAVAVAESMPPANQGFQPLNDLRKRLLELWILNCAVEKFEPQISDDNSSENPLRKARTCR